MLRGTFTQQREPRNRIDILEDHKKRVYLVYIFNPLLHELIFGGVVVMHMYALYIYLKKINV